MEAGMPLLFSLDVRSQLALLILSMPAKPEEALRRMSPFYANRDGANRIATIKGVARYFFY